MTQPAPGRRGIPFVISSPSGGGKTSIYRGLERLEPELFFSISATTRRPREDERDGVQYHFLPEEEFIRREAAGDFIETALVHESRYGTPRRPLEEALAAGRDVVLDIDVQGADSIRQLIPEAVLVFIIPPDLTTLRLRLETRRSEPPAEIECRMENARRELRRACDYDYIVINDELQRAVEIVRGILLAERHRRSRQAAEILRRFPELEAER